MVPGPRQYSDVVEKGPETVIFSTSITKGIWKSKINDGFDGEGMISFRRFPGAKVRNILGYIPADLADTKPESVIIQAGGNDLPTPRGNPVPVETIANGIMQAANMCSRYGVKNVYVAGVLTRKQYYMKERCENLNKILQDQCLLNGFYFIDNSAIDTQFMYDGVHLNNEGSEMLCDNYLSKLNSVYWDNVLSKIQS